MINSVRKTTFSNAAIALVICAFCSSPLRATDPSSYAKMGTPLWQLLSDRQTENTPADLIPFYVFTDGENLVVIPQAFVANYNVNIENPIKLVIPGPETIEESGKYPLLSVPQFMTKNQNFVNKVTSSNPVRPNMLNIYTTSMGTPTTVEHIGRK